MSKYTPAQLRDMAREVMACQDSRKPMLVLAIQLRTGLPHQDIIARIEHYAK